jgi:membrane protein DedA with SNARE-associated domain
MARSESGSSLLLWIGGVIFAAGAVVLGGFWVNAITTAEDMPLLLLAAILAVLIGLAVLLVAAIRDRIIHKKQENFTEVDN